MNYRVGAVSYLNTKPLIHGLGENASPAKGHLELDLPSRLAVKLKQGALDVALIPSVEFLRSEGFGILSDACIACHGPVRSVRLLFRKRPAEVRTLALDEGSRSSAALAQVLLHQFYGLRPEVSELSISENYIDCEADAILVIGDRAMRVPEHYFETSWDLGEKWVEMTRLPFVFAMWIANSHALQAELSMALSSSRDLGLANLERIAEMESPKYKISVEDCLRYFEKQLHFTLGERELAGLDLFRSYATELGLVPHTSNLLTLVPA